jgi:hypothetical protein
MSIILASTFHSVAGSENAWAAQVRRALPRLRELYSDICVSVTPTTDNSILCGAGPPVSLTEYFRSAGIVCEPFGGRLGDNHRQALQMALERLPDNSDYHRVHYCDFDRALLWSLDHPEELERVLAASRQTELLLPYRQGLNTHGSAIGDRMSGSAWSSHPITQKATEFAVNHAVNDVMQMVAGRSLPSGFYADPFGTTHICGLHLTEILVRQSSYVGFPQAEWLAILFVELCRHGRTDRVRSVPVQGLVFETLEVQKYSVPAPSEKSLSEMFSELERSQSEALKRVSIALGMLQSFSLVLDQQSLSSNDVRNTCASHEAALRHLGKQIARSQSEDDVRSMLERFYASFITQGNSME